MSVFIWIITSTVFISLISFIGALTLFFKEEFLNKITLSLVAFSAGALFGGAFFHLIPEAIFRKGVQEEFILNVFLFVTLGFCAFFILENFISWHHHHGTRHPEIKALSYLILISDGVHNFIDGLVIAASFVMSLSVGVLTTLIIVLHEIPQEMGDFAVLIYGGFKKGKALFFNFLSALTAILGGIVGFFLSEKSENSIFFLLSFAAGSFIYIACSDLIPEIKQKENFKKSLVHFLIFSLGIAFVVLIKLTGE